MLFIKNVSRHPPEGELKHGNILLKYFPPNVNMFLQPMDKGVIKATKQQYGKNLIMMLMDKTRAEYAVNSLGRNC